jgi:mRNA interferase HigB
MRIIARRTLKLFWDKYPEAEDALKIWHKKVSKAKWGNFSELKIDFGSADGVGEERIVFNIKGNSYRLIAKIDFEFQLVFIRFVGTHSDYDKMNKKTGASNI